MCSHSSSFTFLLDCWGPNSSPSKWNEDDNKWHSYCTIKPGLQAIQFLWVTWLTQSDVILYKVRCHLAPAVLPQSALSGFTSTSVFVCALFSFHFCSPKKSWGQTQLSGQCNSINSKEIIFQFKVFFASIQHYLITLLRYKKNCTSYM